MFIVAELIKWRFICSHPTCTLVSFFVTLFQSCKTIAQLVPTILDCFLFPQYLQG